VTYQAGDLEAQPDESGRGSFCRRMILAWCWMGKHLKIDWLEVKWPQPSGAVERYTNLPADRYVTIVEGTGKWE